MYFALNLGKESAENLAREKLKPIVNPLEIIIENIENIPINEPTIEKRKAIHFKEYTFYTGIDVMKNVSKVNKTIKVPHSYYQMKVILLEAPLHQKKVNNKRR